MRTLQRFISLSHPVNWVSFCLPTKRDRRATAKGSPRQRVVECQRRSGDESSNSRLWNFYFKYFKSPLPSPREKLDAFHYSLLLLYNYSNAKGFSHCFHFGKDEESSQTHYTGDGRRRRFECRLGKGKFERKMEKFFGNVIFMNGCVTVHFANQDNGFPNEQEINREYSAFKS